MLSEKIINLRKSRGWSQEELAERLNVSRQSVSKWEGAQSVPDMNKILMLSEVFGVSTDFLLGRTQDVVLCADGLTDQQVAHLRAIIEDLRSANFN